VKQNFHDRLEKLEKVTAAIIGTRILIKEPLFIDIGDELLQALLSPHRQSHCFLLQKSPVLQTQSTSSGPN
jgi:hypothetical protein